MRILGMICACCAIAIGLSTFALFRDWRMACLAGVVWTCWAVLSFLVVLWCGG